MKQTLKTLKTSKTLSLLSSLGSNNAWPCRAALLSSAVLLWGCGNYTSDYVPPRDGRARAIWQEDRVVASIPSDAPNDCSDAIEEVKGNPQRYVTAYGGSRTVVIWQPWIVVHHHHHHPPPGPGLPGPGGEHRPARPSVGGGGGGIGSPSIGGGGGKSGGGGGSSGGGNGDLGKAAVVLAVVAIIALPIITLGLGLGRPEPSEEVATVIDEVNTYNDLARLPNSPCMVVAPNGGEQ